MSKIKRIHAREVFDSRGNPTVEVEITLNSDVIGHAIIPSGASVGSHEAVELRDNDPKRFHGMGVLKAVKNVNEKIAPKLIGLDILNQAMIDDLLNSLDGTVNKSKLGANAILGVSLASAIAGANSLGLPLYRYIGGLNVKDLPLPMVSMVVGGAHAGWNLDFQDFFIIPAAARSFSESLLLASDVYYSLKKIVLGMGFRGVSDTGGFCPTLSSNIEALDLLMDAIGKAGYQPGRDICIGVDVASGMFFEKGRYNLRCEKKILETEEMVCLLEEMASKYPITAIEDGVSEDDFEGWRMLTKRLGGKIQLIGDDLFATNPVRLKKGIEMGIANAILVKLNQIGTVKETLEVVNIAKRVGYNIIISKRSAETEDTAIADFAVAVGAGYVKFGSLARSECLAKYNRLLRIAEEMEVLLKGNLIHTPARLL
jgi:enolase